MLTLITRHEPSRPWNYASLDSLQRSILRQVLEGGAGALLLSEVAPVITLGRRTEVERDILLDPGSYEKAGISIYPSDRGGLATYHGPGQWLAFPVERLDRLSGGTRAVRRAVESLAAAALSVARRFRDDSHIREGAELGVWSEAAGGKLASIGIHIEKGVLLHGLALNVYQDERSFYGIRPCGLDARAGFLLDTRPADREFVRIGELLESAVLSHFCTPTQGIQHLTLSEFRVI